MKLELDKIEQIEQYFVGMTSKKGYKLLEVRFPRNNFQWKVFNSDDIMVDTNNNGLTYHVFSNNPKIGFTELINHTTNIIESNLENEYRYNLYTEKVKELEYLFQTLPTKTLESLKIKYRAPKKTKGVDDEIIIDEVVSKIDEPLIQE